LLAKNVVGIIKLGICLDGILSDTQLVWVVDWA